MIKLQKAGLALVCVGIFMAICGGSWDPASGINAAFGILFGGAGLACIGGLLIMAAGETA